MLYHLKMLFFCPQGPKFGFLRGKPPKMKIFKKKFLNVFLDLKWHPKKGEQAVFEDMARYPLPLDRGGSEVKKKFIM